MNDRHKSILDRFEHIENELAKRIPESSGAEHIRLTTEAATWRAARLIVMEELQGIESRISSECRRRRNAIADWMKTTIDTYSENGT